MHICIVGTGAAGWLACNYFKNKDYISKVTIIGSPDIPSIGVGESTTLTVRDFHIMCGLEFKEFVVKSDAAVKYGVMYKNWSKRDFIHYFKTYPKMNEYGKLLANKDPDIHIHDLMGHELFKFVNKNLVSLDNGEYPISWHFDAGKYIEFLSEHALKNPKVELINKTVVDIKFKKERKIDYITFDDNTTSSYDYIIFATGSSKIIQNLLNEKFEDLSNVLLTNKAIVYPLEYKNKRDQFHPYTVAKTMNYGWRWITPTYSRIGTGYVFSSNHISEDEAINEFLTDIGDFSITPRVVDFYPKYNKTPFKENYCTIGMSNGFLEPLDAPGLTLTINGILELAFQFEFSNEINESVLEISNRSMVNEYKFWTSFILTQYKTSHRNDTSFWNDHKSVYYDHYEKTMESMQKDYFGSVDNDFMMFYQTISSKDVNWPTQYKSKPFKLVENSYPKKHHLDFVEDIRKEYNSKFFQKIKNLKK